MSDIEFDLTSYENELHCKKCKMSFGMIHTTSDFLCNRCFGELEFRAMKEEIHK